MKSSNYRFYTAVIFLLLAILASILLLDIFSSDQSIDRVAYVNLTRVFEEHPAKTAAEEKLNKKAAEYQQQLEKEGEKLSGSQQQKLLAAYQKELQNLEAELLASVLEEVKNTIVQTAEEKKVKFVLEEEDVLYGGYNLTDEVLAKLKAEWQ